MAPSRVDSSSYPTKLRPSRNGPGAPRSTGTSRTTTFFLPAFKPASSQADSSSRTNPRSSSRKSSMPSRVGSRNRLFNGRLQLDVEAFHWRYEDQQMSAIMLDEPGRDRILRTQNVGNATMDGRRSRNRMARDRSARGSAWMRNTWMRRTTTSVTRRRGPSLDRRCRVARRQRMAPRFPGGLFRQAGAIRAEMDREPRCRAHVSCSPTTPELVANARLHYQTEMLTGLDFTPLEYQDSYFTSQCVAHVHNARRSVLRDRLRHQPDRRDRRRQQLPAAVRPFVVGTLRPPRLYGLRLGARF